MTGSFPFILASKVIWLGVQDLVRVHAPLIVFDGTSLDRSKDRSELVENRQSCKHFLSLATSVSPVHSNAEEFSLVENITLSLHLI